MPVQILDCNIIASVDKTHATLYHNTHHCNSELPSNTRKWLPVHDELVLPLSHLALLRLLPLLELRGISLSVLQQAHHRAQSDLAVALHSNDHRSVRIQGYTSSIIAGKITYGAFISK